jgi:hypothetical protein
MARPLMPDYDARKSGIPAGVNTVLGRAKKRPD